VILFIALVIGGIVGTSAFLQADAGGWRMIGWAALGMLACLITVVSLSGAVFELSDLMPRIGLERVAVIGFWAFTFAFVGTVIGKLAALRFTAGQIGVWVFTAATAEVWLAIWIGAFL
jgi:hypothetical protein